MKKIKLFLVLGIITALFTACGSSESAIIGRWETDSTSFEGYTDRGTVIEFFSDGTYDSNSPNYNGGYSVDGNRIRLSGQLSEDLTFTFEVSGDTLLLYNNKGRKFEYTKVN